MTHPTTEEIEAAILQAKKMLANGSLWQHNAEAVSILLSVVEQAQGMQKVLKEVQEFIHTDPEPSFDTSPILAKIEKTLSPSLPHDPLLTKAIEMAENYEVGIAKSYLMGMTTNEIATVRSAVREARKTLTEIKKAVGQKNDSLQKETDGIYQECTDQDSNS